MSHFPDHRIKEVKHSNVYLHKYVDKQGVKVASESDQSTWRHLASWFQSNLSSSYWFDRDLLCSSLLSFLTKLQEQEGLPTQILFNKNTAEWALDIYINRLFKKIIMDET